MQFEIFEETSLSENNIKLRNCEKLALTLKLKNFAVFE